MIDDVDEAILNLMKFGNNAKEIGPQINLSSRTIEGRIQRMKDFFKANTLAHLLYRAIEEGFVNVKIKSGNEQFDEFIAKYSTKEDAATSADLLYQNTGNKFWLRVFDYCKK